MVAHRVGTDCRRQFFLHSRVRPTDGSEALVVDPGAYDNLGGDEFYYRVGNKAMQALGKSKMEHVLSIKPRSKELGIQGVGQGQQRVTESASVITGMTEDKELSSFSSPLARNSQLPRLLGLKTKKT